MSNLTKLILKEWLRFFLGSSLVLLMVLSLGHVLNSLLKDSADFKTIYETLILELPSFLIKIFPVSCLIASLFSINKLKNRNELTAIFASGFSRLKFIFTIGSIGAIVGVLLFFINAYLVPYTKHHQESLKNISSTDTGNAAAKKTSVSINALNSGKIWFKGQDYFFSYSSFDRKTNTLYNLTLYFYGPNFKFSEQISASYASFRHDDTWLLHRTFHYTNLDNKTFPTVQYLDILPLRIHETVNDFRQINADIATLNIWKLYDYIGVLKTNGINYSEYYVTFLDKFSSAFTCLVLSILASIALFNPNRRNSSFGKNIAFVLTFTFVYWFIYSYFLTLGQTSRIPAIVATFGVPSIFVLYLAGYFIYHRKLR
ncbi:MAG: LptF/LptG family permease [Bacteriovorax sp.]|nr:LptF/LptG family permease [Bacteriovorax sp.]